MAPMSKLSFFNSGMTSAMETVSDSAAFVVRNMGFTMAMTLSTSCKDSSDWLNELRLKNAISLLHHSK